MITASIAVSAPDACRRDHSTFPAWTIVLPEPVCSGPNIEAELWRIRISGNALLDREVQLDADVSHFGQSGGFIWVDPKADPALVVLRPRFGDWALDLWPAGDAVHSRGHT